MCVFVVKHCGYYFVSAHFDPPKQPRSERFKDFFNIGRANVGFLAKLCALYVVKSVVDAVFSTEVKTAYEIPVFSLKELVAVGFVCSAIREIALFLLPFFFGYKKTAVITQGG